jgi:preprotein translocase subunit SecB
MAKPSLQLDAYFFKKISFEVRPVAVPADKRDFEPQLEVSAYAGQTAEAPLEWVVGLKLASPKDLPTWFPYKIELEAVGFVTVPHDMPSSIQEDVVVRNGSVLLYGSMRELVASISGRAHLPTYFLPTVTFDNLAKEEKKSKRKLEPAKKKRQLAMKKAE